MKEYYSILHVRPDATAEAIKQSYRNLAKRYHPDANPNNPAAAEKFADVNEAYGVLSDPDERVKYNAWLRERRQEERMQRAAANAASPEQVLQAQVQMQINAQVQAQVQAQLLAVKERAYKEGYERGHGEGYKLAQQAAATAQQKSRQTLDEYKSSRADLEQELFDRDRELAKANDAISELKAQLQWLRNVSRGGANSPADVMTQELDRSKARLAEIKKVLSSVDNAVIKANHPTLTGNPKRISEQIADIDKRFAELNTRLSALEKAVSLVKSQYEQLQKAVSDSELAASMEESARRWTEKTKADKRLSKPTLYGALGVLIWADDKEIATAFDKLAEHYKGKSDGESARNMQKIKDAFSVLSDPVRRKQYNASIGIDESRILSERQLIKQNQSLQDKYRGKLAAKEFWARFDELASLALSGDSDAQNMLGEIYLHGNGVERDLSQAVYWFRQAFEQKNPAAMYNLGQCYLTGNGVNKNRSIGLGLLRQATVRGYRK